MLQSASTTSRSSRYLAGLATGYAVTGLEVLVSLWLTPFVLRSLDREAYGLFALGSSVIVWLTVLDLGLPAGLRIYLARRSSHLDTNERNRLISTAAYAQLGIVVLAIVFGIGVALFFPGFFNVPPHLRNDASWMVLLLVGGTAVSLVNNTYSSILVAHQFIHVDNLIRLSVVVFRAAAVVVFLTAGWGVVSMAAAHVAATSVILALTISRCRRLLPDLHIHRALFSGVMLRDVLALGVWFSLDSVTGLVIAGMDTAVAAKILDFRAVTAFALTAKLYSLSQGLIVQVTGTAGPALSQLLGEGAATKAHQVYRRIFAISGSLSIAIAMAILAANQAFVAAWVGSDAYGGLSLDVALSLAVIVNTWSQPSRAVLSSAKDVRPQTLSRVTEATLNLGLSIFLTSHIGLPGVTLSTVLAGIATSFWYLPRRLRHVFPSASENSFLRDLLKRAVVCALIAPVSLAARHFAAQTGGFQSAILAGAVTGSVALALAWVGLLDTTDRAYIAGLLASGVHTVRTARSRPSPSTDVR